MSALASDPPDMTRARRSIFLAEPPFERPCDRIGQRPQMAGHCLAAVRGTNPA